MPFVVNYLLRLNATVGQTEAQFDPIDIFRNDNTAVAQAEFAQKALEIKNSGDRTAR